MPVGPYQTFNGCVAAQKKKGKNDESARKICGELEKRSNPNTKTASVAGIDIMGDEPHEEKIQRIMNEYNIDHAGAVAVVNHIIEEEKAILEAEELELLKKLKAQKTLSQ
jgi:hypothetical protein